MNEQKNIAVINIIEKALMCLLLFMIGIVLYSFGRDAADDHENKVKLLSEGWYYIKDDEAIAAELPMKLQYAGDSFVLYNDSLTAEAAGLQISLKAAGYNCIISSDETVIYQYNDEKFPRNTQMKSKLHCDGTLPVDYDGETIRIEFFNIKDGEYQIPQIYIGSETAVLVKNLQDSVFVLGIAVIMLVLSIFVIAVGLYLKTKRVWNARFINIAFFLIICHIWCVTDAGFVQQYAEHYDLLSTISFFAFMTLAIPMLYFIKNTEHLSNYSVLDLLIILFFANALIQGVLNSLGIFELIEMLFVTHLLLFLGCVAVTALIIKEYRKNKTEEIKTILYAFVVLAASGVIALLLYWSFQIIYYGLIFEVGIIIFVILLLKGIIRTVAEDRRAKTEIEVLRRLAKEDNLTGLGNKRAFEEYLTDLQHEAALLENALLIFIDINYLKQINDKFGHSAGDELIIATAGCLRKIFENTAKCFRIGGDEFCVVIKNPAKEEAKWYELLENEIQRYNHNSRFCLSVAKGGSYLRRSDGTIKTISNWKYQADCKMYEDKGRKRRR